MLSLLLIWWLLARGRINKLLATEINLYYFLCPVVLFHPEMFSEPCTVLFVICSQMQFLSVFVDYLQPLFNVMLFTDFVNACSF